MSLKNVVCILPGVSLKSAACLSPSNMRVAFIGAVSLKLIFEVVVRNGQIRVYTNTSFYP